MKLHFRILQYSLFVIFNPSCFLVNKAEKPRKTAAHEKKKLYEIAFKLTTTADYELRQLFQSRIQSVTMTHHYLDRLY